jgi:hypothetical protein
VLEFPSFVYLDVQKTGSSFVVDFFKRHARDEYIALDRHKPVAIYDPGKFYFITCRDPLDQYLSLYSFGCGGQGGYRKRHGDDMYDGTAAGFSTWLRFMLDSGDRDRSSEMRRYVKSGLEPFVGFQSFRFLYLSFASPWDVLDRCRSVGMVRKVFRNRRIWSEAIRNEDLAGSLARLVGGRLAASVRDIDAALAYLAANEKTNTSERVDKKNDFTVSEEDKRLIQEREWLFFEELGYPRYTEDAPPLPQDALG